MFIVRKIIDAISRKRDLPHDDDDLDTRQCKRQKRVFSHDNLKVYEIVVLSGFASWDIPNLCLSSSVIYKQTKELAMWRTVCHEKWPCTKELIDKFPQFKRAVQRNGFFWLLNQWSSKAVQSNYITSKCELSEAAICVQVFYKNKRVCSHWCLDCSLFSGTSCAMIPQECTDFAPRKLSNTRWEGFSPDDPDSDHIGLFLWHLESTDGDLRDLQVTAHVINVQDCTIHTVFAFEEQPQSKHLVFPLLPDPRNLSADRVPGINFDGNVISEHLQRRNVLQSYWKPHTKPIGSWHQHVEFWNKMFQHPSFFLKIQLELKLVDDPECHTGSIHFEKLSWHLEPVYSGTTSSDQSTPSPLRLH